MTEVEELYQKYSKLTPAEQHQFWRFNSFNPIQYFLNLGIEKSPEICGGSARIIRTRIPVWTLEDLRRNNHSEADILEAYPQLKAVDLVNAWAYVSFNKSEIDTEIEENCKA